MWIGLKLGKNGQISLSGVKLTFHDLEKVTHPWGYWTDGFGKRGLVW